LFDSASLGLALPDAGGVTLRALIDQGPWPTDVAVARLAALADLVAATPGRTTPITPGSVRYSSGDGSGRPTLDAAIPSPADIAPYRAPELDHSPAGTQADVYALGCILFEAIAGKAPFRGQNPAEVRKRHASAAAPGVRQVRVDCELSPTLELEIQRALKKRPGDRHPGPAAFAQAIRATMRDDDRATMALGATEAAFLQQLLASSGEAPDGGAAAAHSPRGLPAQRPPPPGDRAPAIGNPELRRASRVAFVPADTLAGPQPVYAPPPPIRSGTPSGGAGSSERGGGAGSSQRSATTMGGVDEATAGAGGPASGRRNLLLGAGIVVGVLAMGAAAIWVLQGEPPPVVASAPREPAPAPKANTAPPVAPPVVVDSPDVQVIPQVAVETPDAGSEAPDVPEPSPVAGSGRKPAPGRKPKVQAPDEEVKPAKPKDGPITF